MENKRTEEREKFNKNLICQVARKGKFLDFSNGLVVSNVDDYAQLMGRGGKNHAPLAVIKVDLTDYKDSANHVKCTANVEPYVFDIMKEVALRNIGSQYLGPSEATRILDKYDSASDIAVETCKGAFEVLNGIRDACRHIFHEKTIKETITPLGASVSAAIDRMMSMDQGKAYGTINLMPYSEWQKIITRVDTHSQDANGYANVKELTIRRQQYMDAGGALKPMGAQWYIAVCNFKAKPVGDGVGYIPGSVLGEKSSVSINITDEEVVEICYHIQNFVRIWQNTLCIPIVKTGCQMKEAERRAWLEQKEKGN